MKEKLWIEGVCDSCQEFKQLRNADCELYFCKDCWEDYKNNANGLEKNLVPDFFDGVN